MKPIVLDDDTSLEVRPIEPSDGEALVAFHDGLSLESTRLRYFSPHPLLSRREVVRLTTVDHQLREALVVLHGDVIVAVARYEGLPDGVTAEVAFVVAEAWRRRGIATELLQRLAGLARERGMHHLVAETLSENRPMSKVFVDSGIREHHTIETGVLHFDLDLDAPQA